MWGWLSKGCTTLHSPMCVLTPHPLFAVGKPLAEGFGLVGLRAAVGLPLWSRQSGTRYRSKLRKRMCRSEEEKEGFRYALHETMDLWNAHQGTTVFMLTKLPEGSERK
eukprot:81384-Prymnesium_polylepis.1